MYTDVSDTFKAIHDKPGRTFAARIEFESSGYEALPDSNSDILSIKLIRGNSSAEDISIGDVSSAMFTAELTYHEKTLSRLLSDRVVWLYFGVDLLPGYGDFDYVPMGKFKVKTAKKSGNKIIVTFVDNLYDSDSLYVSNLTYPNTALHIFYEICDSLGIGYDIAITVRAILAMINFDTAPTGFTKRQMLSYMVSIFGKNACLDRKGKLKFYRYDFSQTFSVTDDSIDTPTLGENVEITALVCNIGSGNTLTCGEGRAITFENPFMTQEHLDNLIDIVSCSYTPCEMNQLVGSILLDIFDVLEYNGFVIPIMSSELYFDGGVSLKITAYGKTAEEAAINSVGTAANILNQAEKYTQEYFENSEYAAHIEDKENPHSVTYTQTGAAAEKHEHESYLNSIAKYYASADNMSADDLTVPVALIYMSSELNSELCSMFKASFAFILTVFYGGTATVNRRTQVALSYNNNPSKIAIRSYISESSGWTPWKNVTNDSTNILPIDSGGTGATTVADVLTNLGLSTITTDVKNAASVAANAKSIAENHSHDDYLRAIATYYSSGMEADNLTVPWALIHAGDDENIELYNIIGSGFIYVMTLFYNKQDLTSRRVQLAFNYSSSDSRMAIRHFYASGWTPWKPVTNDSRNPLPITAGGTGATTTADALTNLGLVTKDISDSFLSEVISGCTVTSKSVYKYGNVISGTITFNYTPADDEVFVNLFVISQTYRPKTDIIQVQLSLKREEDVLFPTSIAYFDTGSFTMNAMGMTYDSGLVSFCYICN